MIDFSVYPSALHHSFHLYSKTAHAKSVQASLQKHQHELNNVSSQLFGSEEIHFYLIKTELLWDFVQIKQWRVFHTQDWLLGKAIQPELAIRENVIVDYSFEYPFHSFRPDLLGFYKLNAGLGLPLGYTLLMIPKNTPIATRQSLEGLLSNITKEEIYLVIKVFTDLNYRGLKNLQIEANYKHHLLESIRGFSFIAKKENSNVSKSVKRYEVAESKQLSSYLEQNGFRVQFFDHNLLLPNYVTISKEQAEMLTDCLAAFN